MIDHAAAADAWIQANPNVMHRLEQFALAAKETGRTKLGIGLLIERVRWYESVEKRDALFKINNNHRAYIARHLMKHSPRLDGFFDLRRAGDE